MYISPYGKPEGLAERLDKLADDFSADRYHPFLGLGPIADLRAAAALLAGRPIPIDGDDEPTAQLEWDL